jgi:alkylation response protein AidB-like acyl-CoA dehydrogenase
VAVDAVSELPLELRPVTAEGERLVALAERHAADFAEGAAAHDRENSFPAEHWAAMRTSGYLAGSTPAEFGGGGVRSVHDLAVATSRLARGDPGTALGANMHLSCPWLFTRLREDACRSGDTPLEERLRMLLMLAGRGRLVACIAFTEPGTYPAWPATEAVPVDGGGYRINGRKTFCTNSPACTLVLSSVRVPGADGGNRLGFAVVPRSTPGLEVRETWDALGMRASGSHDVVFADCVVRDGMVVEAGELGELAAGAYSVVLVNTLTLVAAPLGIAEAAHRLLLEGAGRRKGPAGRTMAERPAVQRLVAENEIDLAVGRAMLARSALRLDEYLAATAHADLDGAVLTALMKDVQCTNVEVKARSIAVVDRALTGSGGGGYLSRHPLSRLYRDVRAGPFMQPFSLLEAHEFIGRVALGLPPEPDA